MIDIDEDLNQKTKERISTTYMMSILPSPFIIGMMDYDLFYTPNIAGGHYNETAGSLTIIDGLYDLVCQVNIFDKSISGTIPGVGHAPFWLNYQV